MIDPLSSQMPMRPTRVEALHAAAEKVEVTFLTEMLQAAGLGRAPQAFGGGEGEEQFASFLVAAQAEAIVGAGGIGIAQSIFDALAAHDHG